MGKYRSRTALIFRVTDFLIVLNSRAAVQSFMAAGSLTLGGNLSVAVGPLGRNAEGVGSLNSKGKMAAMYSYSKTKGLFGGMSVEGSIIVERQDANRIAYGSSISAKQILNGTFDAPDWVGELVDEIERCTGLPGGQRWQSWDEDGEGGGMGWATPKGEKGGYVFGEGVGAGGGESGAGGSGFGGGGKEGRKRGSSVGMFDQPSSPSSPSRPGNPKRSSSFNPFSHGSSSPKRQAPAGMASSENYNAGLTWDSDGPMMTYGNRSRASSRASSMGFTAVEDGGRARSYSDPKARRGPHTYRQSDDVLGDLDEGRGANGRGDWSVDEKGLSTSFAKMSTGPSRLRASSKPPLPGEDEYVPYESSSTFGKRYSPSKSDTRKYPDRGISLNDDHNDNDDPFGESDTTGRAFESYHPSAGSSSSSIYRDKARPAPPPPQLSLKPGLSPGPAETGYARAVALFDLPAGQAGDLGLKKGQVVYAMDKVGSGEWWRGMAVNGETGIFPANYVEVLEIPKKDLKGGLSRSDLKKRVPDLGFD